MIAQLFKYRTSSVSWEDTRTTLRSYRRDHITRTLKKGRFYESEFLQVVAKRYGGGGTFVDVGAFIGNHSIFFATHCTTENVIAFEPFPETYRLLVHNVRANGLSDRISCRPLAVGQAKGTAGMSVVSQTNMGMNRIDSAGGTVVTVTTLDTELANHQGELRFIKIDTEGQGSNVLRGAQATIDRFKPVIAVETDPEPLAAIVDVLRAHGYEAKEKYNATPTWIFEHRSHG